MDGYDLLDSLFLRPPLWDEVGYKLAPEGWDHSPLFRAFHPTLSQVIEESLRMAEGLASLTRQQETPEKAAERVAAVVERTRAAYHDHPSNPDEERLNLAGLCLWDVLAEHTALDPDGRELDLGSWRGAAGEIADWLNGRAGANFDYMDFYMGSFLVGHRADLGPVYQLIFDRLRKQGYDWRYCFPRLNIVHLSNTEPDESYFKIKTDLDLADQQARREARQGDLPRIVKAYQHVFGREPSGWPP